MDENRTFDIPRDAEGHRGPTEETIAEHNETRPAVPKPAATKRPPANRRSARRHLRRWVLGGIALLVAGGIAAWGIIEREDTIVSLGKTANDASVPKVTLVSPQKGPTSRTITLPGQTDAWYTAPIFAQVTGYVKQWFKDYGAPVQKGDLLATISTPDLDQQLQQARAQLEVAETRFALAKVTAQRWQKLSGTQAVSQETVDVNLADAKAQQASVRAAQFNVARYEAQEAFKNVVAPFDGVVTARDTDVGNFVNAAGGNSDRQGQTQLFTVSDIHEIRIFVAVPQDYSGYINPGLSASMTLPQFPDRTFDAKVLTVAKAFNTDARTVVTELTVPNPKQEIWPGSFAEVKFTIPTDPNILIIPEQSLLFRSAGLQVALVDKDNKVHLQNIKLGLNLGQTVQVTQGLKSSDRLIANPSDGLLEGETVDVVKAPPQNSDEDSSAKPVSKPSSDQ